MKIIVEGFDDDIAVALTQRIDDALVMGLEELAFQAKLMSIKATISLEDGAIVIRKDKDV
ncbi:MAG: hypothetical protein MJ236_05395 [Clostridia bacterium]|nr:hypothetical protein [Clostridia bacterium]